MKSGLSGLALYLYINNLSPAVHPVGGIDPVRPELGSVGRIGRQLRRFELVRPATLAGALFRLFAFRLAHDEKRDGCECVCGKRKKGTGRRPLVKCEKQKRRPDSGSGDEAVLHVRDGSEGFRVAGGLFGVEVGGFLIRIEIAGGLDDEAGNGILGALREIESL